MPLFQQPVVLARRVATIDHLSGGRMDLGIAMGWLPEEFEATGVPVRGRATAYEESVAALRACWGPDPVGFKGEHFTIPLAKIGPKPLDGFTLFGGGVARAAIERAARITDGLTLAFRDWDSCLEQIKWYRDAGGAGRIILRAGPMLPHPQQPEATTTFTEPAILDDLQHAADVGVHRVDWDLNIVGMSIPDQLDAFRTLADRLGW